MIIATDTNPCCVSLTLLSSFYAVVMGRKGGTLTSFVEKSKEKETGGVEEQFYGRM